MRAGSSCSTCAFVRLSTKGAITRRNTCCTSRSRSRSIGVANRSLKRVAVPSRPGLRKLMIDHSSVRRFSTGVPESAMRKSASRSNNATERFAAEFLIACASSAINVCQLRFRNASAACCSSVYETTTTSNALARASKSARSVSAYRCMFRLGAKRCASAIQLPHTEVGATTSAAPSCDRASSTANACRVLPSPMSSARQAPNPAAARRMAQT